MLQGALIKVDKTVLLRKNFSGNSLIIRIVVHKTRRQKQIWIVNKRYFIIYPSNM